MEFNTLYGVTPETDLDDELEGEIYFFDKSYLENLLDQVPDRIDQQIPDGPTVEHLEDEMTWLEIWERFYDQTRPERFAYGHFDRLLEESEKPDTDNLKPGDLDKLLDW